MYRTGTIGSNIPTVVKNLLIINVLFFVGTIGLDRFGVNLTQILGLHFFKSYFFEPYQFVTHMFMHGGIAHIFLNMFMLWMFGRILEQVWGGKKFLIYYFITGLGAAILHTFVNYLQFLPMEQAAEAFKNTPSPDLFLSFLKEYYPRHDWYGFIDAWKDMPNSAIYPSKAIERVDGIINAYYNIPTVGASGAVYGVLLAFGMLFPNTPLFIWFIPIPVKAKYVIIGLTLLELSQGLSRPGSNIAHFAHLGGMLFGFLLIRYWNKQEPNHY